jgi:hypothetical protein
VCTKFKGRCILGFIFGLLCAWVLFGCGCGCAACFSCCLWLVGDRLWKIESQKAMTSEMTVEFVKMEPVVWLAIQTC